MILIPKKKKKRDRGKNRRGIEMSPKIVELLYRGIIRHLDGDKEIKGIHKKGAEGTEI